MVHKLIYEEQKVSLTSKELSGHVLVFTSIQNTSRGAHSSVDTLHEVLEPLIDQSLLLALEFDRPLSLGKVVFEVLLDFLLHELSRLQDPLVDRVEEGNEHEGVGRPKVQPVMIVLIGALLLNEFRNEDACLHILLDIDISSFFTLIIKASGFKLSVFERKAWRVRLRGLIKARFLRVGIRRRGVFTLFIGAGPPWGHILSAVGR